MDLAQCSDSTAGRVRDFIWRHARRDGADLAIKIVLPQLYQEATQKIIDCKAQLDNVIPLTNATATWCPPVLVNIIHGYYRPSIEHRRVLNNWYRAIEAVYQNRVEISKIGINRVWGECLDYECNCSNCTHSRPKNRERSEIQFRLYCVFSDQQSNRDQFRPEPLICCYLYDRNYLH
jgi:hypothetical protein